MQMTCKLQGAFDPKKIRASTHHSLILLRDFTPHIKKQGFGTL
jgi:hypothetical protein